MEKHIFHIEPSVGFEKRVIAAIRMAEVRKARLKAICFGTGALGTALLLLSLGVSLYRTSVETGFAQYLSLAFSGDGVVLVYWKELALSLADSLPFLGVALFCGALALSIWSFLRTAAYVRSFALQAHV